MALLGGGDPELSTCEGCFPEGFSPRENNPSQVDNSGCPPTKIDNGQKVIPYFLHKQTISGLRLSPPNGKNLGLSRVTILLSTSHGEFLGLSKETSQLSKSCDR